MEIKASFAHATTDRRTMGSKGLTALVRKQIFIIIIIIKYGDRTYSWD